MKHLAAIAERVNTGLEDMDTSRALVVFNQTQEPKSGFAVFRAVMSWPRAVPLPPVVVTQEGQVVPSVVGDMTQGPDAKGRADRCQLGFSLCFAASDIPADGWRTYIAAYTEAEGPTLEDFVETPGLVVAETTRHGGDLPPVGVF